jgi:hypothetical protein
VMENYSWSEATAKLNRIMQETWKTTANETGEIGLWNTSHANQDSLFTI